MSHFGRSGPPDIKDTFSLLVLNITFRTTADDLYPLFDRYGKVVDIFIPRDKRTGESRGFAFVRYKRAEEAQKAVERLDGMNLHGRDILVQFAKYGRSTERIHRGRITSTSPIQNNRSESRSPRRGTSGRGYHDKDVRRDRYDRYEKAGVERDYYRRRSATRSRSHSRSRSRGPRGHEHRRRRSPSRSPQAFRGSRSHNRKHSPRRSLSAERSHEIRNDPPKKGRLSSKDNHRSSAEHSDRRSVSLEPGDEIENASLQNTRRKSPQRHSIASPCADSIERSSPDKPSQSPNRSAELPSASPASKSASDFSRSPSPAVKRSRRRTSGSASPSP